MSEKLRGLLWTIAALLAFYIGATIWLRSHDHAVVQRALQNQHDQQDNITISRLAGESFAQESTFQRERDSTARVIAKLRARVIPRDSIVLHDTVQVAQQLDARDSLTAAQDQRHVQDSLQGLFWKGQVVAYRDTTVPRLETARDNWKRAASKPSYMITDIAGGAAIGYGLAQKNDAFVVGGVTAIIAPRVMHQIGKLFRWTGNSVRR